MLQRPICVVLLAGLVSMTGLAAVDVPPRGESGQVLVVPEAHVKLGDVYHVAPAEGTQCQWISDAPLLRVHVVCNRVVGYFVAPFELDEGQPPLLAGALRIPVASLQSGQDDRDATLHSAPFLNVAQYPEMTFVLVGLRDVQGGEEAQGKRSFTATADCEFTVKDKTVAVAVPLRLTFAPFTWQAMRSGAALTDMLVVRARFDVQHADLGLPLPGPAGLDFAAERGTFDLFLFCGTSPPDKNLDPQVQHEHYRRQMRFLTLLRDFDDPEQAYAFGAAFMRDVWDDAAALNRLAWAVLTERGIRTRDLAFVLKAARRANELTESKDPELLRTLARAHADRGDFAEALRCARLAAEHVEGAPPPLVQEVRTMVAQYEKRAATD